MAFWEVVPGYMGSQDKISSVSVDSGMKLVSLPLSVDPFNILLGFRCPQIDRRRMGPLWLKSFCLARSFFTDASSRAHYHDTG